MVHSNPIAHAKLALLGNVCWTDEDPVGGVTDYIWFSPKRLWVSSDAAMAEAADESYQARIEMAEINGEELDEDEL